MRSSYKDLFRVPTALDKLTFFQTLLEAGDMHADLALALLKPIHAELGAGQIRERRAYRRYAETMAFFQYRHADMVRQVIEAWRNMQAVVPPEWFASAPPSD